METSMTIVLSLTLVSVGLVVIGFRYMDVNNGESITDVPTCPCSDVKYCERITDTTRKEIFVFSINPQQDDWRFYNWDKVTTVVMVGYLDMQLVCLAHFYGARAITIGDVDTSVLTDAAARTEWVSKQLDKVKQYYLDGVNFDYESAIMDNETSIRDGYTALVAETTEALKKYSASLMVSVDVAWSPDCVDLRCYDYVGLSKASDFLFVMAYDEQSQILGKCIAGANSAYKRALTGIEKFVSLGVPTDKLVLGMPWYGYKYRCLNQPKGNECAIRAVAFRGVNCSDAAGSQLNYYTVIQLLKQHGLTTGNKDLDSLTMYFNYKDDQTGEYYQLWYDDPWSLDLKYSMAVDKNLRGVGMWNAEAVKYTSQNPDDIAATKAMWDAFPDYKTAQ